MYKRRVHLLFVHPFDAERALAASQLAQQIGQNWLESRGTAYPDYMASSETTGSLGWADLVIHLGDMPASPIPIARHAQLRCWQLPEDQNWLMLLSTKIHGVIGGLRMLARVDASMAEDGVPPGRK